MKLRQIIYFISTHPRVDAIFINPADFKSIGFSVDSKGVVEGEIVSDKGIRRFEIWQSNHVVPGVIIPVI